MLHHVVTATPLDWSQPQVGAWTCLERCSAKSSSHTPAGRSVTCAWAWQIKASAGNMSSDRPQSMIDCTTPFCSLWEDPMPHLWMLSQEGLHLSLWGALCRWVDILMQVNKNKNHALPLAGQWPVGHLEKKQLYISKQSSWTPSN